MTDAPDEDDAPGFYAAHTVPAPESTVRPGLTAPQPIARDGLLYTVDSRELQQVLSRARELKRRIRAYRSDPTWPATRDALLDWEAILQGHHKDGDTTTAYFLRVIRGLL